MLIWLNVVFFQINIVVSAGKTYQLAALVEHKDGDKILSGRFVTYVSNYPKYASLSNNIQIDGNSLFSYNKYDLGTVSRFGLSSVLNTTPYILVYDRVPEDDHLDVASLVEHVRLVHHFCTIFTPT